MYRIFWFGRALCAVVLCLFMVSAASADIIGFSPAEGYSTGDLDGQPSIDGSAAIRTSICKLKGGNIYS